MQSLDRMLLEWARRQPPEATYEYGDTSNCALCQFLRDTGICSSPRVGGNYWRDDSLPFPSAEHALSNAVAGALIGNTYGGLADRLEQALS